MQKNYITKVVQLFSLALLSILIKQTKAQQQYDFNMPYEQTPGDGNTFFQYSFDDNSRQILYPKREFRCAWIATVSNIDYPSTPGLSVTNMKNEFISIMNKLKKAGINAVFVQIRPSCDAFYNSPYEPWSEWLTGTQGVAPSGGFDPLVFMIQEAHSRGIEFHAWINPYRAVVSTSSSSIANTHVSVTHPSWCVTYNSKKLLNPGLPQVRDYVTNVIADIVTRYDIDGIHFDDYFYPYPANGQTFNDNSTFSTYPRGFSNIDDWRRDNVNIFINRVNDTIKYIKPYVKFGIGPFGIWKSGVPSGITGLSSYYDIYCDPINWLNNQYIDYVAPQLYWKIGTNQDFNTLVNWWGTQANNNDRHCYAGMASYQLDANSGNWAISEILNQISSTRSINNIAEGECFFSTASIKNNTKHLADSLTTSYNKYKCLIPTMPWLDSIAPLPPVNVAFTTPSYGVSITWQLPASASDGDSAKYFVIYRTTDGSGINTLDAKQILYISPTPITSFNDTINLSSYPGVAYAVTACDKLDNESSIEYVNVTITPPSNDNCSTAQTINTSPTCTTIQGNLQFSSGSGVAKPSCDNFSSPALLDVWYQFIATASNHTISSTPDGDMDAVIALYSACSGAEIACADHTGPGVKDSLVATNLTIGNSYLVRVYDYGSAAPATTTFNICVNGPSLSTEITENSLSGLSIYPNPFNGSTLFGSLAGLSGEITIELRDIVGKQIQTTIITTNNGNFALQLLEPLQPGIYMVLCTNNTSRITKKVIVN